MTEAEWLASANPLPMLDYLLTGRPETGDTLEPRPSGIGYRPTGGRLPVVTERKLRLFAVACCYGVSEELGQDAETCVEWNSGPAHDAANWARGWVGDQKKPTLLARAALLREVFGNPWRPMTATEPCPGCDGTSWAKDAPPGTYCCRCMNKKGDDGRMYPSGRLPASWLRWNNRTVPRMAQGIYDDRAWGRMPALADALLDAGCDDEDLLQHCRGLRKHQIRTDDGVLQETWLEDVLHVRGCWAVDLLLGKE